MSETDVTLPTTGSENGGADAGNSAPASATDVSQAASSTAPAVKTDAAAPATAATDVKTEKPSMLDKVKEILSGKKEAPATPSTAESEVKENVEGKEPSAENADPAKKPDAKDDVPKEFAKHPAWQRILKERDTFRHQATQYQNIDKFLSENKISGRDAAEGLKLVALIYSNPAEAMKRLDQIRGNLGLQTGTELPPDLKEEVANGYISQERAKELSMARNRQATLEAQNTNANQRIAETNNQQHLHERAKVYDAWEASISKTDPDLQKKLPMMEGVLLKIRMNEGDAQTAEAANERLNRAHQEVTNQLRNLMPRKAPVAASPQSSGGASVANKQPTTVLEGVQSVLARRNRGL